MQEQIGELRTDMQEQIGELRTGMQAQFGGLRTEMHDESSARSRSASVRWPSGWLPWKP